MRIVKLDAIDSTNDYLKNLAKDPSLENWTVVRAENQTAGRGQHRNRWICEPGKNLTFSVLAKFTDVKAMNTLFLNCAVSLAVYRVLSQHVVNGLYVKWPNDILADSKKLCGILIENTLVNDKVVRSVIGVGLNVNQEFFNTELLRATSLFKHTQKTFDRDALLIELLTEIQRQIKRVQTREFSGIKADYESFLYRRGVPSTFKDKNGQSFVGTISGIDATGNLVLRVEEGKVKTFRVKEIKFI